MKPHIKNPFILPVLITSLVLMLLVPSVVQAQFNYTITNGAITITGYTGSAGSVIIPITIGVGILHIPVISIGTLAFEFQTSLTSVTIPNSVTSIGDSAFYCCTSLTSVTIPNNVTNIADEAFESCWSLSSITIPDSVTSIAYGTFLYCYGLTNVTIPDSVTNIGFEAFSDCPSLTSVYFQGNAPSFDTDVFDYQLPATINKIWDPATIYYLPGTTGWVRLLLVSQPSC
jgi:hypothetical protein